MPRGGGRGRARLGPCMVKAQVGAGRRGKAGGIRPAATPAEAEAAARAILGMTIGGERVERVLVERRVADRARALRRGADRCREQGPAAPGRGRGRHRGRGARGGRSAKPARIPVDIRHGITADEIAPRLAPLGLGAFGAAFADVLARLYGVYAASDAELVEINPLALTADGALVALDCKLVVDDAAASRQAALAALAVPERRTPLEAAGAGARPAPASSSTAMSACWRTAPGSP